jgi:hypothetical protein
MSGTEQTPKALQGHVPTTALAVDVRVTAEMLWVTLQDGREIGVPLVWFPRLHGATPQQRNHYQIDGGGLSIHWSDIDEDLCVANLLAGADWAST